MRKLAVASTYSGSSNERPSSGRNVHLPNSQPLPSSSFSNAYNSFFAPPAIAYSTPAPSVADTSPAHIEEIPTTLVDAFNNASAPTIGAVLPSSSYQPFVLSDESDLSGSTENVSPISVPHLIWKGQIWNSDDVQVSYDCLLDDGAHLVLIRPETVADLGLPVHRLHEHECVTLALNNSPESVTELWNYVFLSVSSLNNTWSSCQGDCDSGGPSTGRYGCFSEC
jgi:hypothetical protein